MSNLTLSMALARNATTSARDSAQQGSPLMESPSTPIAPVDGLQRRPVGDNDEAATPAFSHTISAIFVPLKQDLLAPIEPAKDPVEHLQELQKSLDANETAVRDNMAWMFEREARRRVAVAKKMHDFSQPHRPEIVTWSEADQLIASMSTVPALGMNYHARPDRLAEWHERIGSTVSGYQPPHEQTTRDILFVANDGSREIEDYSLKHIKPIREKMQTGLEGATGDRV